MTRPPTRPQYPGFDPDPLFVEPEPVRRARRDRETRDESGDGRLVVWIVVAAAVGILLLGWLALSSLAAPRSAQTTGPAPSRDVSAIAGVSSAALTGAPRERDPGSAHALAEASAPARHDRGAPPPAVGSVLVSGTATWYCSSTSPCTRGYRPRDLVAAIDPTLGIARGTRIRVTHGERSVVVRVVDVCACAGRRVIDLTSGAFARLAPLSRGVIEVELEVLGPRPTLPATDLEAVR